MTDEFASVHPERPEDLRAGKHHHAELRAMHEEMTDDDSHETSSADQGGQSPWQDQYVVRSARSLRLEGYEDIPRGSIAETTRSGRLPRKFYEKELRKLQIELVKLQEWIQHKGLRVVILFEGRDAAGKGGVIKRITARLNPRVCRIVALPAPSDREVTQWYFQRYIAHLPAAGEMLLFDRSWYNRAGVERVMSFCTEDQYQYFMKHVTNLERMLVDDGILLIKYWFAVGDKEQEHRFQDRLRCPEKRWKLSPMDLQSRVQWEEYTKAKDYMFEMTDIPEAPWYVVKANDKRRARLNCISHILSLFEYEDVTATNIQLPPRQKHSDYVRRPIPAGRVVPEEF